MRFYRRDVSHLQVISPRNHMVFTPLLSSTTVGTLEARSVAVHIATIQKAIHEPQNQYLAGTATGVFPDRKVVEAFSDDGLRFFVNYDKLAIATGSQGSTFGIPGVEQHAHFLRDISHSERIRNDLIHNVALAGVPGRQVDEFTRLLHIVIVGGGPTGVEVAGELSNLINRDLRHVYPDRARAMRITLVEARELLGNFDVNLREYAARKLVNRGVRLKKGIVKEVQEKTITLTDGTIIPYGLCIWSTGVGPTPFTLSLPFAKTPVGRLAIDGYLRVLAPHKEDESGHVRGEGEAVAPKGKVTVLTEESQGASPSKYDVVPDVYALGDCCANTDAPLPALAQVAEQQGKYLAHALNQERASSGGDAPKPFEYKHLGSMATVGGTSAIMELGDAKSHHWSLTGFWSWVAWRSAYLTRLGSMRNRMVVMFDWTMTLLFGRDISRW
eukprot:jgi/Chrzof1/3036/Cz12g09060.t1